MAEKEIQFIGLLGNVDSSIIQLDLKNGYQIESVSLEEGLRLFSQLEGLPPGEVMRKLLMQFQCLCEEGKRFYFASKSFKSEEEDGIDSASSNANKEYAFYLDPLIKLLRLFKEGNICMPVQYYVSDYGSDPKCGMRGFTIFPVTREAFSLKGVDMEKLNEFIQNTKLPFKQSFVQLSFENFELSYQSHSPALSFLSLMISLETLLNPADSEVTHRISRNAAFLLGKDSDDSGRILSEVEKLYRKRSKLIHAGDVRSILREDLLKLRTIVRETIKAVDKSGLNKEQLMEALNEKGFT